MVLFNNSVEILKLTYILHYLFIIEAILWAYFKCYVCAFDIRS